MMLKKVKVQLLIKKLTVTQKNYLITITQVHTVSSLHVTGFITRNPAI